MSNKWFDCLTEDTRPVLKGWLVTPQGVLHMKNLNGRYGKIFLEDLVAKKLLIKNKKSEAEYHYTFAGELIAAGWAID